MYKYHVMNKQSGLLYQTNDINEARKIMQKFNDDIKHNPKGLAYIQYMDPTGEQSEEVLRKMCVYDYIDNLGVECSADFMEKTGESFAQQAINAIEATHITGHELNPIYKY